jgi:hypothetical protein
MRNNTDSTLEKLFAVARSEQIDTADAEEYFETRLMAHLRERREARRPWHELAWRCIPTLALIALLLVVVSMSIGRSGSADLFAAISSGQEEYLAKSYMSGE